MARMVDYFHNIDPERFARCRIIVDIDGTLTCPSRDDVRDDVMAVLHALQRANDVVLFSNNFDGARSRRIAASLSVPYLDASCRKPRRAVADALPPSDRPIVVIGDKFLTDELFAVFVGARYVRVRRYMCRNDSLFARVGCVFDDVVRMLCGWCVRARQ